MKTKQLTNQEFLIIDGETVYGCSYRKANKTDYYIGKVSVWDKENWEDFFGVENRVIKDIKIGTENPQEKLTEYVENKVIK